ncbi:hypothetical protein Golax_008729 [Gossypium laxum]|uniref:Uncharacterized protein n=2 Tax=Gossypium TaxID=3633 RepID=A0A7J8VA90_9ROSI|nr:hypothetical protein [Gossypium klotzschianum]MBA0721158.1 hypothetical protein [Gossypium laxum]
MHAIHSRSGRKRLDVDGGSTLKPTAFTLFKVSIFPFRSRGWESHRRSILHSINLPSFLMLFSSFSSLVYVVKP